jgi:hypothetical protein
MATSVRLSRGFHRLALFLAAIPLLAGIAVSVFIAKETADSALQAQQVACAHVEDSAPSGGFFTKKLAEINAAESTAACARAVSWGDQFSPRLGIGLAITLAGSLAVYGIVRAIGWVIGGFAAS